MCQVNETPFDEDLLVDIITGLEVTVKKRNWAQEDQMLIPKDYSTPPPPDSHTFVLTSV